jgi:single-strand DNA-binding protein
MLNGTQITIVGNTGDAPELRYTASGTPVASFSVAVPQRKRDAASGEWKESGTTWYRVNAWRDLAEHTAGSIGKGTRVIVVGSLASREWERDGRSGTSWEVTADAIGPDLMWADASVRRAARDSVPLPDDPWAGETPDPEDSRS